MSIYAFAEKMMTRQAKENPFLALMPGMEPLQKTTETWMRGMGLPVGQEDVPGTGAIEANIEAAMNAMPELDGVPNLAVHPMAAMAAGTAVSMGAASHAMGAMFGTMTGMMENAMRLQKATRDVSVFAPPGLDMANPLKFDWSASTAQTPASAPKAKPAAKKPAAQVAAKPKTAAPANAASQAASKAKVAAKAATPAKRVADPAPAVKAKPVKAKTTKAKTAAPAPAPKTVAKPAAKKAAAKKAATPVKTAPAPAPKTTDVAKAAKVNAPKAEVTKAKTPKAKTGAAKKVAPLPAAEPVAASMPARPGGVAPAAIMPEDFKQPKKIAKPEMPDDLKQISGVGPKLEQVLNGLGIWTFKQIAGWKATEVAWVDDYLQFSGRIERDDWIAQAAKLAKATQAA